MSSLDPGQVVHLTIMKIKKNSLFHFWKNLWNTGMNTNINPKPWIVILQTFHDCFGEFLFKFIEARSDLYPKKPKDNRSVDTTKFSIENGFLKSCKGVILEMLERTRLVKAWIKVENVWLF